MVNEDIIQDVCLDKKTVEDWERIYNIKVSNDYPRKQMNEFEFAYWLNKYTYVLCPDENGEEYERAAQMEMRALKIYRDLIATATRQELAVLIKENKYMATRYILDYR